MAVSLWLLLSGKYFTIPDKGGEPFLREEQEPLIEADVYSGDPGLSATVYETDYAPFKPRCDVVLNGSAYAPQGKPAIKVPVSFRIGSVSKVFNVIGNRCWEKTLSAIAATPPAPFMRMPISYNCAFGGTDNSHRDHRDHRAFMENPVGVGFHVNLEGNVINGKPLPNTEQIGETITRPDGSSRPMSFGVVGRGWEPRHRLAGTYDQKWAANVFPFLPSDFNDAYFQCSPADQQMGYLAGGEMVELINLTPLGRTLFQIPRMEVPVVFFRKMRGMHETRAVADTLVLEPDNNRFMITWRACLPLKRKCPKFHRSWLGACPVPGGGPGSVERPITVPWKSSARRIAGTQGRISNVRAAPGNRRRRHGSRGWPLRPDLMRGNPLRTGQLSGDPVHGFRRRMDCRQQCASGATLARYPQTGEDAGDVPERVHGLLSGYSNPESSGPSMPGRGVPSRSSMRPGQSGIRGGTARAGNYLSWGFGDHHSRSCRCRYGAASG